MRKSLLFALSFALCGFVAACSDSGKSDGPKATVTIEADGVAVNSLELVSSQVVNLKAILKDKNGADVDDYTTAWTCTEGLGSFSVNNSSETVFTAMNGSMSGGNYNITASCNGVTKKVRVTGVESFSIRISFSGSNTISNTETLTLKATVTRAGQEVTDVPVTWSTTVEGRGTFSPAVSYSGNSVTYTPTAGFTGSVYVQASANGVNTVLGFPINVTD